MKQEREAIKMSKNELTEQEIDQLIERVEELFRGYQEKFNFSPQFMFLDVSTYFDWEEVAWKRFGIPPKQHLLSEKSFRTYRGAEIICMFAENYKEGRIILA